MTELEALTADLDERIEALADHHAAIPQLFVKAYNCQQWTLEGWRTWCDARRLGRLPSEVRALWDEVLKPAGLTSGYRAAAYGEDASAGRQRSLAERSGTRENSRVSHQPTREYDDTEPSAESLRDAVTAFHASGPSQPLGSIKPSDAVRAYIGDFDALWPNFTAYAKQALDHDAKEQLRSWIKQTKEQLDSLERSLD